MAWVSYLTQKLQHLTKIGLHIVRTSSLSTFDSIEMGRYSDDLDKENDDKVAVLEFELRKAYDTIKSLRGSLTEATGMSVLGGAVAACQEVPWEKKVACHEVTCAKKVACTHQLHV